MKPSRVALDARLEPARFRLAQKLSLMAHALSMSIALREPVSLHRAALFIPMVLVRLKAKRAGLDNAREQVVRPLKTLLLIVHQRFATSLWTNASHRLAQLRIKMAAVHWELLAATPVLAILKAVMWVNALSPIARLSFLVEPVQRGLFVLVVSAPSRHAARLIPKEVVVPI